MDVLIKRGTDAQHASYIGGDGELTRNIDTGAVHIHDGVKAGGDALALKADLDSKVDTVAGKGLSTEDYTSEEKSKLAGIEANATGDQTASEILTAIKTVDGSGSGLDADLLDGQHATAFAAASHSHAISDVTGLQTELNGKLAASGGTGTNTQLNAMRVRAASAQSGTAFAVNFANGDYFPCTATGNAAVTFSNFPAGMVACAIIKATNWGGKTVTFPVGTKIVGGSLSLTTSGTDLLGLVWDGSAMSVTLMAKDVK